MLLSACSAAEGKTIHMPKSGPSTARGGGGPAINLKLQSQPLWRWDDEVQYDISEEPRWVDQDSDFPFINPAIGVWRMAMLPDTVRHTYLRQDQIEQPPESANTPFVKPNVGGTNCGSIVIWVSTCNQTVVYGHTPVLAAAGVSRF